MSGDINVQTFSGKVNITSNLLVGSSHLFVDTTNNRVGITTASPGASLEVNGNVHVVTDLTFGGTLTGNGSGLTNVNSDSGSWVNGSSSNIHLAVSTDNVGIGTVDPDGPLHLVLPATSNYTGFTYQSGDVKTVFGNTGDDSTNTSFVQVYAGVSSSVPDTNSGTYHLALQPHGGNVGIGGVLQPAETLDILGSLRVGGDGMLTINERTNSGFDNTPRPETIALQTTIDGRTLAQGAVYGHEPRVALALQPDFGYVGIGKVDPKTRLHIINVDSNSGAGDAYISGRTYKPSECLRLTGQWRGTGSGALLKFTNTHGGGTNPNTGEYNTAGIAGFDYSNQWGGGLVFYTSTNTSGGGNLTERMVIDNSGFVGIGTSSPSYKLHVSAGDNSITFYGPNTTWNSTLAVGAASDKTSSSNTGLAQCISTNGNLHLDAGHTRHIYMNHYRGNYIIHNGGGVYSDDRLKSEEELITNATDTLLKLSPQKYLKRRTLREDEDRDPIIETGLMAQDIWYDAPELRHLVHLGDDANPVDTKPVAPVDGDIQQDPDYSSWGPNEASVNYDGLIAYLIKSNQEIYEELQTTKINLQTTKTQLEADLQATLEATKTDLKADLHTTQTELTEERALHETTRTQLQDVLRKFEKLEMRTAYLESALIS
jgi:hypothetical protein